MKTLWTTQEIDAPAAVVWELLAMPEHWPSWGPSVQGVSCPDRHLGPGSSGTVTTVFGVELPFEVTAYNAGFRWAWRVAGVPATDHRVDHLGPARCRVGFGVPWVGAPYLLVCRRAMRHLDRLATRVGVVS